MDTMTLVQVEELCTSTVNRTPIMRPTTGFVRRSLLWKTLPGTGKANVVVQYTTYIFIS